MQYCLWSTLHHRFKQDLSKSVDKKYTLYTVSMHVNVGWDLVYPREDSIDRPGSGFTTNPEWGQMLLLPLNLYTLLPLGTDDMMRSVWKYTCLTFTCGHFTVRMENGIFNQLGSRWSCGCLGIIVELKFQNFYAKAILVLEQLLAKDQTFYGVLPNFQQ